MIARIRKWGHGLALRIPRKLAREAGLREGSVVEVEVQRREVTIEHADEPPLTLENLLEGVTEANLHREVNTGQALGQEMW